MEKIVLMVISLLTVINEVKIALLYSIMTTLFKENPCAVGSKKWIQTLFKSSLFMDTNGILEQ